MAAASALVDGCPFADYPPGGHSSLLSSSREFLTEDFSLLTFSLIGHEDMRNDLPINRNLSLDDHTVRGPVLSVVTLWTCVHSQDYEAVFDLPLTATPAQLHAVKEAARKGI